MPCFFKVASRVGSAALLGSLSPQMSQAQATPGAPSPHAFVTQYCVTCHSDRGYERGAVPMSLQGLDLSDVGAHAESW